MDLNEKSILITGADGFIGSHLTERLVNRCRKLRVLCLYNSFNTWGWLDNLDCLSDIEVVVGDIRDPHFCKSLLEDIDVVFHLAALIAIPYSYHSPLSYIETNVKGTLNLCQHAVDWGVERFVHTSTSEVYGTAIYTPIDEDHPLQAQSPYSASKIGGDAVVKSYYYSYKLPVTIARPFNTYGPRQSARAVIPNIISQILNKNEQLRIGALRPTRDFNYVLDTCEGLISLCKCEQAVGEVTNIGSGKEISIEDLIMTIKRLLNSDISIVEESIRMRPESSEVYRLVCNSKKLRELTEYKPLYSLEDGLKKTIKWFSDKKNIQKYKSGVYNV